MPSGTMLAPGFIDLQVNGGGGILLNDEPTPDAMRAIARAHRRYGTTSCLPTLISDTRAKGTAAIAAAKLLDGSDGILGLHLEGPFISLDVSRFIAVITSRLRQWKTLIG
jgi:N-acetylglucosamine-6-phosphate deacetylase